MSDNGDGNLDDAAVFNRDHIDQNAQTKATSSIPESADLAEADMAETRAGTELYLKIDTRPENLSAPGDEGDEAFFQTKSEIGFKVEFEDVLVSGRNKAPDGNDTLSGKLEPLNDSNAAPDHTNASGGLSSDNFLKLKLDARAEDLAAPTADASDQGEEGNRSLNFAKVDVDYDHKSFLGDDLSAPGGDGAADFTKTKLDARTDDLAAPGPVHGIGGTGGGRYTFTSPHISVGSVNDPPRAVPSDHPDAGAPGEPAGATISQSGGIPRDADVSTAAALEGDGPNRPTSLPAADELLEGLTVRKAGEKPVEYLAAADLPGNGDGNRSSGQQDPPADDPLVAVTSYSTGGYEPRDGNKRGEEADLDIFDRWGNKNLQQDEVSGPDLGRSNKPHFEKETPAPVVAIQDFHFTNRTGVKVGATLLVLGLIAGGTAWALVGNETEAPTPIVPAGRDLPATEAPTTSPSPLAKRPTTGTVTKAPGSPFVPLATNPPKQVPKAPVTRAATKAPTLAPVTEPSAVSPAPATKSPSASPSPVDTAPTKDAAPRP